MLSDRHKIFAPVPFTLVTLETLGTFLYPNPLDVKFILLMPPVVIFDDVTASLFPGVVEAVKNIEKENSYSIVYFDISKFRSIAIATKK